MNYSAPMVSQYFPTFYSNGTQKRLAQYSQGFQDLVHQLFGKYCTEIERERYRKGKRSQLPCDIKKDMQLYQHSSHDLSKCRLYLKRLPLDLLGLRFRFFPQFLEFYHFP